MDSAGRRPHVRLDSRTVLLLRETGCERAFAMVSAGSDTVALDSDICADDSFADDVPPSSGAGALRFGQIYENMLLEKGARSLRPAIEATLAADRHFGPLMTTAEFDVQTFARGPEGTITSPGNESVWKETSKLIISRFRDNARGSILIHPVIRVPSTSRPIYLVPDVLISPPRYPYYVPFEIKSYERMAHLTEDHHIASATVQASLYLYSLMHGAGEGEAYPEQDRPRSDLRVGIVFRVNGTALPDPALVSAERDLAAIAKILEGVQVEDDAFLARFGQKFETIRSGRLSPIEHVASTFSDACAHACRLAGRCRDVAKTQQLLTAYGDALLHAYPGYASVGQIQQAIRNRPADLVDPNLARLFAVEDEIDRLLRLVTFP
jgi:hypothetical protein